MYKTFRRIGHRLVNQTILTMTFLLWAGMADAQSAKGNWDPQFTLPPGLAGCCKTP
jgi:hypothetical protein